MRIAVAAARILLTALLLNHGVAGPAAASEAVPAPAELEAAGARIGAITIRALDIFNLDDPAENRPLFRAANRLHRRTRESVLRDQLLFATGDAYSERLLAETERNLRELRFLREPSVRATAWHDGVVDVEVVAHDVWTLQLGPTFSRSGGENSTSISFEDKNLFGYGKTLIVGASTDVERRATTLEWRDPSMRGSRWQNILHWSNTSDGRIWRASLWRPFYSLDTRRAFGALTGASSVLDTRYRLGESFDRYRHRQQWGDFYAGWSRGLRSGRVVRFTTGLRWERDEFRTEPGVQTLAPLPADRLLNYPYLRLDWVTDRFATTTNLDLIARTEDLQFGLNGHLVVGAAARGFGADRDALLLSGGANYGRQLSETRKYFLSAAASARLERGQTRDLRSSYSAAWYQRTSPRTLFHARLSADAGARLDLDHYYEMGGDNGLRGYPLRYQQGSSRVLLKLEERVYTPWSLWRLFDIGAAAFVDAGRTSGGNPLASPRQGWLRDVGVGLRLGNSRSSLGNVIHIDLATPLDGERNIDRWQVLVSTQATF